MPSVPRPNELTHLDDSELKRLAVVWRVRAGRGQREAFGIAQPLEVEQRLRLQASRWQPLTPPDKPGRRWWQIWKLAPVQGVGENGYGAGRLE